MNKILFVITALLVVIPVDCFLAPYHKAKYLARHLSPSTHLYQDEPNPLDSSYVKKEEHDPKHSTFHVDRGLDTFDSPTDPAHSIHHHLIDVDHDKLHDLELKAQNAWKPVNVHEVEIDPVSAVTVLFVLLASILFAAGLSA
ncbi:hypothetical protein HJC23_009884 [Cyclotella cryptica]|uniref:Uncharacterized protein n=1 Tax=Cyclotella cryptica TaxID=29204 RepID=A0ABD3QHQ3_9STRA|eukprot:CCRYP_006986-RA/>CCRYP_006986-RA protein AED:0.47 eAED:0.47 QI:0/-1/0/1/-1/1/1/0/141